VVEPSGKIAVVQTLGLLSMTRFGDEIFPCLPVYGDEAFLFKMMLVNHWRLPDRCVPTCAAI